MRTVVRDLFSENCVWFVGLISLLLSPHGASAEIQFAQDPQYKCSWNGEGYAMELWYLNAEDIVNRNAMLSTKDLNCLRHSWNLDVVCDDMLHSLGDKGNEEVVYSIQNCSMGLKN